MAAARPSPGEPDRLFGSREAAEAWRRGEAERAAVFGPATELMLDLADVRDGSRVLDVAAGTGAQTIVAARRVGPTGFVVATDISASMLELAGDAAREAGLTNVATRVMDAQSLDLEADSFDAAISRNGLMLVPEIRAALAGIRRALKPGRKLAAMVFSTVEKNPYLALPQAIVRRRAGLPSSTPSEPGMFALGDPGVLEDAYRTAGFRDVAVHAIATRRRFRSVAEAIVNLESSCPRLRELAASLSDAEREAAWAEIEQALRQFDRPSGFEAPGETLVGVGTK
jgi:ubiquinone/menaquinone biosynthesis C-methylase UbiE